MAKTVSFVAGYFGFGAPFRPVSALIGGRAENPIQ